MKKDETPIVIPIKKRITNITDKVPKFVDRRPLLSFFSLLGLLVLAIVISNFLRKPTVTVQESKKVVKQVNVYRIGTSPKIRVQAQIEKTGVVQINALAGGVVQKINFEPGQKVRKGSTLVSLSTNYQGGNAPAVQSQIAAKQYQNAVDTFPQEKEVIEKQKDLANKNNEDADRLRNITEQSLSETRSLIDLNSNILDLLGDALEAAEAMNMPADILSIKISQSQFVGANNQLRSQLRSDEYQSSDSEVPAQIENITRDIAIKQLELQEKTLTLNKELSGLQLQLARINEGIMYPASPFNGTVQRVLVKVGQAITPGTPLVIVAQTIEEDPIVAIAYVSREIAQSVSFMEPSVLHLGTTLYDTYPSYVTQDAVQGTLYAVYYPVPDNFNQLTTEKGFMYIDLPIGGYDTNASIPFIPIDSIYQTQDKSYIYVINKGKAESRTVKIGSVFGRFVQIESGLNKGDSIILDRNVIAGDEVQENK